MVNEDMNQVMGDLKSEVFRDLRVASQAVVVAVRIFVQYAYLC